MVDRISPGKTPFVTERPSKWSRLSNQQIINRLLNSRSNSVWEYFFGNKRTMIVGSAIYKWYLRQEPIEDIDAICEDTQCTSNNIKREEPSAFNSVILDNYHGITDYSIIKFTGTLNMKVDLIKYSDYALSINKTGLSMINSLVLTEEGIRHVLEVPELKDDIALEAKDPEAEREWIINQIKNGKYCVWRGMREKDKEYFKSWSLIDPVECAMHGMYKD